MKKILVYQRAAIGDSVLATPVSVNLKKAFPQANITYVTHASLISLLSCCPSIDEFISTDRKDLRLRMQAIKPDLTVDLSGSSKSFLETLFLPGKTLRYRKREKHLHAVDNYLETISSICEITEAAERFPTLFLQEKEKQRIKAMLNKAPRRLLALVPGVGSMRPHRAWPEEHWLALSKQILESNNHAVLLIGGTEERTLCSRIAELSGEYCFNLAGKLSLVETAAALSICDVTVSGDTGSAHISIATGTPVIGLYGPTAVGRSGPYGRDDLALSASEKCQCTRRKSCLYAPGSAGRCMGEIPVHLVHAKMLSLLSQNRN